MEASFHTGSTCAMLAGIAPPWATSVGRRVLPHPRRIDRSKMLAAKPERVAPALL